MKKMETRTDKSGGAMGKLRKLIPSGITCLIIIGVLFGYIGSKMGAAEMLNTIMHTAHDLLLNTVFYLMGICVLLVNCSLNSEWLICWKRFFVR